GGGTGGEMTCRPGRWPCPRGRGCGLLAARARNARTGLAATPRTRTLPPFLDSHSPHPRRRAGRNPAPAPSCVTEAPAMKPALPCASALLLALAAPSAYAAAPPPALPAAAAAPPSPPPD